MLQLEDATLTKNPKLEQNTADVADYSRKFTAELTALRLESGFVNHAQMSGLLPEVLQTTLSTHVMSYQVNDDVEKGADVSKMDYIKTYIITAMTNKVGTESYKPTIYNYLACVLPGISLSQYFEEGDTLSQVYSNMLFVTTTLFSRYFFNRSKQIAETLVYFDAHYSDLNEYLEELCGLGLIDKKSLGNEVKTIGYIVVAAWEKFMIEQKINDFSTVNDFRVVDASMNMFKALARYLIIERTEKLKVAIREKLGEQGVTINIDDTKNNYPQLVTNHNLNIDDIISKLQVFVISADFITKTINEFSSIMSSHVQKSNLPHMLNGYGANHIGFVEIPNIIIFLSGLNKIGYVEALNGIDSTVTLTPPDHCKVTALKEAFGLDLFTTSDDGDSGKQDQAANRKRIMQNIGAHIKKRTGAKFSYYLNEACSFLSGVFIGIPIFAHIYQDRTLLSSAYEYMTPVLWSLAYALEKGKNLIAKEEQRFEHEYKEYENKVEQLIHGSHFSDNNNASDNLKKGVAIVSRIIHQTYATAGIDENSLADKEKAFMATRLFNTMSDAILKFGDKINLTDSDSMNRLIGVLSQKYAARIEQSWWGSISRGCFAAASFKKGLSKDEILADIATILGENIGTHELRHVAHHEKQAAQHGNAAYFGSTHIVGSMG
ncbi:MAG: hypothetical protein ACHP6I_03040 [Rickettsiales bacterium]